MRGRSMFRLHDNQTPDRDLRPVAQHDVGNLGINQDAVNLGSGQSIGEIAHAHLSTVSMVAIIPTAAVPHV
jgi:hypothetical protein